MVQRARLGCLSAALVWALLSALPGAARAQDEDGHRYWIFRDGLYQESALGAPSWYLHGVFA